MILQAPSEQLQSQAYGQGLQRSTQLGSNAVTLDRPSKRNKKSGLPVVKAWCEHTPDSLRLSTDVSYSFVARRKVTLAVSIPKRLKGAWRELLRARKLFGTRGKNLSVFVPALFAQRKSNNASLNLCVGERLFRVQQRE